MESEREKLFVANLKYEVTENHLKTYFTRYGKVNDALIVRHKGTSYSRGFGFVTFEDPSVAETVLDEGNHMILHQKVDVKKAKPKNQTQQRMDVNGGITENGNNKNYGDDSNNDGENNDNFMDRDSAYTRCSRKKIFVGGLPQDISKEELRDFFETFGAIKDVVVIFHRVTKKPRGFGFVTFESEEAVAIVLKKKHYRFNDRDVEVKMAEPKVMNHGVYTHSYNSYSNSELSYGSGYQYYNFYLPVWCPYGPCSVCAYRGILYPTYSIYDAQHLLNHQDYNEGEEHMNSLIRRSTNEIGECSLSNNSSADDETTEAQMNNVENKLAST